MSVKQNGRPWVRLSAILTACYVTLIGLLAHLDPEIILVRSVLAATVTAVITAVVMGMLNVSSEAR